MATKTFYIPQKDLNWVTELAQSANFSAIILAALRKMTNRPEEPVTITLPSSHAQLLMDACSRGLEISIPSSEESPRTEDPSEQTSVEPKPTATNQLRQARFDKKTQTWRWD